VRGRSRGETVKVLYPSIKKNVLWERGLEILLVNYFKATQGEDGVGGRAERQGSNPAPDLVQILGDAGNGNANALRWNGVEGKDEKRGSATGGVTGEESFLRKPQGRGGKKAVGSGRKPKKAKRAGMGGKRGRQVFVLGELSKTETN